METKQQGLFDNFTLKMIAIITMVIDHVGYILFPDISAFRAIGRIAFPIFCFLIVEGFFHTRNTWNYLIRLSIFAILSEIPFDIAFYGEVFHPEKQNVFITLALGLCAIFCLEEMNTRRWFFLPFFAILAIAFFCNCDYNAGGVLLICTFYKTRENKMMQFLLCSLLLYLFFGAFELYGLLAFIPIFLYNGKRGPSLKMVFYWFYPVHLLILYGISHFLIKG
ncbi:MAG: TraX family protein [Lachnospiraceae bacterium]